ncbi:MAG: hypothetical protein ABS97_03180 [Lysobacteraceae bacterium SCN 69-320]|nr:MAG: hypothetical protein ABS97_03180 [Xanthomonadaceae bacterium SCN 69-320]
MRMTGQDRTAAEHLAANVAAASAARRTLADSGSAGLDALLSVAAIVIWSLLGTQLTWPLPVVVALAALTAMLPPWLRNRRLRRQLDAALLLLAHYEHPPAPEGGVLPIPR